MSKVIPLFLFLCIFISCQSTGSVEYEKPDYTDEEILDNEIAMILGNIEEDAVYSLWLSHILYEETNNQKVAELYNNCVDAVITLFNESIENNVWDESLRLGQSLLTVNSSVLNEIKKTFDSSLVDKLEQAKREYENLVLVDFSSDLQTIKENENTNSISTFITGVVTVWVDLGVKVERGLGYPNRNLGSGFFIDERGYIITNHHVISELVDPEYEGYSRLYIKLSNDSETRIPAKVVGWDKTLDLALLKTEITPPYVYSLGSSQNLTVGNQIYAIGSPLGLENTITSGIISAFDRQLLSTAAVMQIDAAVNSGNSGGPLINTDGEVQGIVFAGLASQQGLNFAIPVEYLQAILLRLYSEGEVNHSWIGALGKTIKEYPSDELGLGVEVLYVMPGSAAFRANIEEGSIVTAIDGLAVRSIEELQFALIHLPPNSVVTIELLNNDDKTKTYTTVYLDERPEQPGLEIYNREPNYKMVYPLFGMELIPSSVANKNQFSIASIVKGGIADESGFSVHDPVEIRKTVLSENKDAVFIETFTKKRKSGYFEVNVSIGAALDSPFIF